MKLLAPVSSLESAKLQIEAGASEIYLGGDTECFNRFTFTGRGKYNVNGEKVSVNKETLCKIVEYAHKENVTVMYTANIPFVANDLKNSTSFVDYYIEYIKEAIDMHVDSIVIADLSGALILKERGLTPHLTASVFFESMNVEQIRFLESLGFQRVVLSYQVTLEEIRNLTQSTSLEIEVFGHYGCSFYDGYCNLKHSFGESKEMGIGTPCRNCYQLMKNEELLQEGTILNSALICSLCSLIELNEIGIYALKLVGRAGNIHENVEITKIYAKLIRFIEENRTRNKLDFVKEFDCYCKEIIPRWWRQGICKRNLCKYKKNSITQNFIGASK